MDLIQALGVLIVAIAGLISTGTFVLRRSEKGREKALEGERRANQVIISDLRGDLARKEDSESKLLHRVGELEADGRRRDERERESQEQLEAALTALSDLQEWRGKAQAALESKDRTITDLRESLKRTEGDCVERDRTIDRQQAIIETQDKTLQYFATEHAKSKAEPAPVTGAAGINDETERRA